LISEGLAKLLDTASGIAKMLIVTHNDPDPDAMGAAAALSYLLKEFCGIQSEVVYFGIIGRAENRAMATYLGDVLRPVADDDFDHKTVIAMVDTQPGAGNNPVEELADVRIVIDHHPERVETQSVKYAEVHPSLGACSTLMTGFLREAGLEIPTQLATALFYGIKTDTRGLSRGTSAEDVEAYFYLQPLIDIDGLAEIEYARVPADYFKGVATMLKNLRLYRNIAIAWLGESVYPGMAAEMADILLRLEGIDWVVSSSAYKETIIISARTHDRAGGAVPLVLALVGNDGTAGGHGMLAGGQIPLNGRDSTKVKKKIVKRTLRHFGLPEDMTGTRLENID
jgi:nanoRNase/pAp phosphatase (c-di-AMP/oligoRNAs hydrolase)